MLVSQSWYLNVAVDRVSLIRNITKSTHTLQPEDGGRSSFKSFLLLVVTNKHTHESNESTPINLKVPDALIILVYRHLN